MANKSGAARPGFEPELGDSKSPVLPLDDRALHYKEIIALIGGRDKDGGRARRGNSGGENRKDG